VGNAREESDVGASRRGQRLDPIAADGGLGPAETGIRGLDAILKGGLPRNRTYLIHGDNGTGKTTLGLQFCVAGAQRGERVLYLATCETLPEIYQIAHAHHWTLDGVTVHFHDVREILGDGLNQSVFHPAELELPKTIDALLTLIDEVDPQRLVIDSLSEIRLLAADSRWFRRQVLALKQNLAQRECTTLFCDDRMKTDQPINSIVHGIINLEQITLDFGPTRRRLSISKLRGQSYTSGYHDFKIRAGGIELFPRLIAAEHRRAIPAERVSSGLPELDSLFGDGIVRGTSTLLLGPAGTGKSSVACQYVAAAAQRGERSAMYLFDEQENTLLQRVLGLGMNLEQDIAAGTTEIQQVDPAELTPGEFIQNICRAVCERDIRLVVLDSLAGFIHAMPDERMLVLHLHELLSYLNQQGVTVLLVIAQHGLPGSQPRSTFDLSYISDSLLLFHCFEFAGELRKAISAYKHRGGEHERTLRELSLSSSGIQVGEPLRQFHGILTGTPRFLGTDLLDDDD